MFRRTLDLPKRNVNEAKGQGSLYPTVVNPTTSRGCNGRRKQFRLASFVSGRKVGEICAQPSPKLVGLIDDGGITLSFSKL